MWFIIRFSSIFMNRFLWLKIIRFFQFFQIYIVSFTSLLNPSAILQRTVASSSPFIKIILIWFSFEYMIWNIEFWYWTLSDRMIEKSFVCYVTYSHSSFMRIYRGKNITNIFEILKFSYYNRLANISLPLFYIHI